jgi:hypothetical protein
MLDETGFDVVDAIAVGDLSAVQSQVMPQAQNVKVQIVKAAVKASKDGDLKSLNVEFKVLEGITVTDAETGAEVTKYVGKSIFPGFMDLVVWANPETKTSQWYKDKQHLLGFKEFCKALEIDLKSVVVNDEFISSLVGRELTCNIVHEAETAQQVNQDTGKQERVKTGAVSVRLKNFRKVA